MTPYGPATVNPAFATHLAWELKVPIGYVEVGRGNGVVFQADGRLSGPPAAIDRPRRTLQPLTTVGRWSVSRAGDDALVSEHASATRAGASVRETAR